MFKLIIQKRLKKIDMNYTIGDLEKAFMAGTDKKNWTKVKLTGNIQGDPYIDEPIFKNWFESEYPIEKGAQQMFYIKTRGSIGNSVVWWGKDSRGYTSKLEKAGIYDINGVKQCCTDAEKENVAFPIEYIDSLAEHTDDTQKLDYGKMIHFHPTRVIFVGIHNKPNKSPLDSSTKTGKIVDSIIENLPQYTETRKTNLFDMDQMPEKEDIDQLKKWWMKRYTPQPQDVVVLFGKRVADMFMYSEKTRNVIKARHPASVRGEMYVKNYVSYLSTQINEELKNGTN